jgi:hypothetical protein
LRAAGKSLRAADKWLRAADKSLRAADNLLSVTVPGLCEGPWGGAGGDAGEKGLLLIGSGL